MTTTTAHSQAIEEQVAKGHTRQCAERMVLEKRQCECAVENFELRELADIIEAMNRLNYGAF